MSKKPILLLVLGLCFANFSFGAEPPQMANLDHETLFHWNDLKETEDQLNFFKVEQEHRKLEAELALTKLQMDQRLYQKAALSEFDLKKSQKNYDLKSNEFELAQGKLRERLIYIEIKKQTVNAKLGKRPSIKETAQLYSDDWKAKLELGNIWVKGAQIELDFANYHYNQVKTLNSKEALTYEELLEVTEAKKEKETNLAILQERLKTLQKNYEEAQKLADELKP